MIESPRELRDRRGNSPGYPAENLSRYRYHTGADLTPIEPDEPCPILFRDIGPIAMACFLRGELRRLAGPYTPITYMRTEAYVEPYNDYEAIGRLVFLRPLLLHPWYSGIPGIYVARATLTLDMRTVAFIPGSVTLAEAAGLASAIADVAALREVFGGRHYDSEAAETAYRLDRLAAELEEAETLAQPLRLKLQSADSSQRIAARALMVRGGLVEDDLCTAWHHLPRDRRQYIRDALRGLAGCPRHDSRVEEDHA